MRINGFNDFEGKERVFEKIETRKKVLGAMSKDKQITQVGIYINKAHDIIPFVTEWLADEL